ncbi:MAG: tautomerase family protein [Actinocrinis sp.]
MPLVRIDLPEGRTPQQRAAIGQAVHDALVTALNVPAEDRFQVITEHAPGALAADPHYLGIERSGQALIVDVTLNEGRSVELKKAFYRAVADNLHDRVGLRREDVVISLTEVRKENWSFGNGEAQYA